MNPKIGIRPIIDGRKAERENLEEKVMSMAQAAKKLIEKNLKYLDGTPVECVIADTTISGSVKLNGNYQIMQVSPCFLLLRETCLLQERTEGR